MKKDLTAQEKIDYTTMILQETLEKHKGLTVPNKVVSFAKGFEAVGVSKNTLIPTMALKHLKNINLVEEIYGPKGLSLKFANFDYIDYKKIAEEIITLVINKRREYDNNKAKAKKTKIKKNNTIKVKIEPESAVITRRYTPKQTQEKFFIGELCFLVHEGLIREGRISRIEATGKNFEFVKYGIKLSSDTEAINVDTNIFHSLDDLAKSLVKDTVKYK